MYYYIYIYISSMVHLLKGRYVTTEMSHEMLQTSILSFNFKSLFKAKFLLATFHHGWFQTSFPKPLLHLVTHWVLFQSSPSKPPKTQGPNLSLPVATQRGRADNDGLVPAGHPKATRLVEESRWLLFDLRFSMVVPVFLSESLVAQAAGVNDKNLPSILWLLFIPLSFQIFTSKRMRVAKSNLPEAISSEITRDICSKL